MFMCLCVEGQGHQNGMHWAHRNYRTPQQQTHVQNCGQAFIIYLTSLLLLWLNTRTQQASQAKLLFCFVFTV